jgi:hypothetical protein
VDANGEEVPGVEFRLASSPYQRFDAAENADELIALVEPKDLPEIDGIDLVSILGARPAEPETNGEGS